MNKEVLYDALMSPSKLKFVSREELERVAIEFPYFNSAHVLLARTYKNAGDHRFSDQLQLASQSSGDRISLYHLLKDPIENEFTAPAFEKPMAIASPTMEVERVVALTHTAPEPVLSFPIEEIKKIPIARRENEFTAPSKTPETPLMEEFKPKETVVSRPVTPIIPEKNQMDLLEESVLVRAVHSSIEQEVNEIDEEEVEDEISETDSGNSQFESIPEREEVEQNLTDEDSFAAWMVRRAKDIGYDHQSVTRTILPTYDEPEREYDLSKSKKKSQQDLIDKFITNNPRITQGKSDEFSFENVARTSITEDLSLVSETMAVLLASQGKKEKARKVYRKLMELHPEKSVYFAAQLKNLDKLK